MNMKQHYTLWSGTVNGEKRYGVNKHTSCGVYTTGPHDGFFRRSDAVELLQKLRKEDKKRKEELAWAEKHPLDPNEDWKNNLVSPINPP